MKTILLNWKHFWVDNYRDYSLLLSEHPNVLLAPPAPLLSWFAERHPHQIVAQEVTPHALGAHTGAIGPAYLKKLGVRQALIGHQEQRLRMMHEQYIQQQYLVCCQEGMMPILCIGEKERHLFREEIAPQITFLKEKKTPIALAYEPLWAIGKQQHCPPEHITEVYDFVCEVLSGRDVQEFFYGGSILEAQHDIAQLPYLTGLLIGRLSLDLHSLEEFLKDYQQHIDGVVLS